MRNNIEDAIDIEKLTIYDFITEKEISSLNVKLDIARRLIEGNSYRQIVEDLAVSTASISKVATRLAEIAEKSEQLAIR